MKGKEVDDVEFSALRDEIILRLGNRQQILNWTILIIGGFLSFSFGQKVIELLAFCPPIVMILAFIWGHNEFRIRQIGYYLRKGHKQNWELWRKKQEDNSIIFGLRLRNLVPLCLFVLSQIILIILAFSPLITINQSGNEAYIEINKTGKYLVIVLDIITMLSAFIVWLKVRNHKQ